MEIEEKEIGFCKKVLYKINEIIYTILCAILLSALYSVFVI